MRSIKHWHRQAGLTLVELMIGLAIALFILAVVAQVFFAASTSFKYQSSASRIQENARFAMDSMVRDIRDAGFQGCGLGTGTKTGYSYAIANTLNLTAADWNFGVAGNQKWWLLFDRVLTGTPPDRVSDGVLGFDNGGTAGPKMPLDLVASDGRPGAAIAATLPKPDAIVLRYADLSTERVVASQTATTITTTQAHGFNKGDVLVAWQDCVKASVFQMTNMPLAGDTVIEHTTGGGVTPGNCSSSLKYGDCANRYGGHAQEIAFFGDPYALKAGDTVSKLVSKAYYIAPASGTNDGTNSLWVRSMPGTNPTTGQPDTIELMRGVQDMQIRYGYTPALVGDENGYSVSDFLTADQVPANRWDRVLAVQVQLLLRSEETGVVTEPMAVQFAGQTFTAPAADRHLYRPYSFTVGLRNRTK